MEKNILLEILKIPKPPTEFQDACLKIFCAVRATLQLEDFNVEGLTRGQFAVCSSFHYQSWLSFSLLRSAQSSFGGRGGKPKPSKHKKKILEKNAPILNFLRFFFGWVTGSFSLIGVRSDPCCSMQSNAKHPQWAGYNRGSIPNSSGYAGFPAIVYAHGVAHIPPIGADR